MVTTRPTPVAGAQRDAPVHVVRRHVITPDDGTLVWRVDARQSCPECGGSWARSWFDEPGFPGGWATAGGTCTDCRYVGIGDLVGEWTGHVARPRRSAAVAHRPVDAAPPPCHGDASDACVPGLDCDRCPLHVGACARV